MSHEGSAGGKPAELFLSRVSPKKVPPLLLQPATLNPNLSTVRPPLRTSPKVESLQPRIPPSAALFLRRFFTVSQLTRCVVSPTSGSSRADGRSRLRQESRPRRSRRRAGQLRGLVPALRAAAGRGAEVVAAAGAMARAA